MKFIRIVAFVLALPVALLATVTSQVDKTGPFLVTALPQTIPTGFPFVSGSDLLVLDIGPTGTPIDPANVLTLGSDYTVTGGGYNTPNAMQTGSVVVVGTGTHTVAVNDLIVIMRNAPVNQVSSFTSTGPLTIALLEQALDKTATLAQQINEMGNRSLQFENFEFLSGVLSKKARAGNYLAFDANGNPVFITGTGGGGGISYFAGTGLTLAANTFSVNYGTTAITAAAGNDSLITGAMQKASNLSDLASVITAKANLNFGNVINVRDYGATGNGSTDDSTAIAAAFAAMTSDSTLYFPAGVYLTSAQFSPPASLTHITIKGDGWASVLSSNTPQIAITSITKVGTTATVTTSVAHGQSGTQNFQIAGATGGDAGYYNGTFTITVTGPNTFTYTMTGTPAANATGTLVSAKNINMLSIPSTDARVVIRDMQFLGNAPWRTQSILLSVSSSYSSVEDCLLYGAGNFALRFTNDTSTVYSNDQSAVGNTILNAYGDGIHVGNGQHVLISANNIGNVGDDGIACIADNLGYGPIDVTIVGNHLQNIGYNTSTPVNIGASGGGIDIRECTDVNIVGNTVTYAKQAGIEITRYQSSSFINLRINVNGNKLEQCDSIGGTGGIDFEQCEDSNVNNNDICDSQNGSTTGIYAGGLADCTISGNTFDNNASSVYANTGTTDSNGKPLGTTVGVAIINNITKSTTAAGQSAFQLNPNPNASQQWSKVVITGNTFDGLAGGALYSETTYVTGNALINQSYNGGGTYTYGSLMPNSPQFFKLGIGTAAPTTNGDLIVNHSAASTTGQASVVVSGTESAPAATDLHPNAFRDTTTYVPTLNGDAYASFDANAALGGTINPNHFSGYQCRISYGGSGTFTGPMSGFYTSNMGVSGTGTVPFMRGFYVSDPSVSGGGSVGQFDGLYIDQLTAGTTRHAIYCAGNDPWFSAGGQIFTSALLTTPAGATTCVLGGTFNQTAQTGLAIMNSNATATGTFASFCNSGGTVQGTITQTNSTTTAYNTSSDARLKTNIRPMTNSGAIIDAIQPHVFDWKWGGKNAHGFIAQELYGVFPEAVTVGSDVELHPWSVDYSKLTPVLTAEVKSLRSRVAILEARQTLFVLGVLASLAVSLLSAFISRRK